MDVTGRQNVGGRPRGWAAEGGNAERSSRDGITPRSVDVEGKGFGTAVLQAKPSWREIPRDGRRNRWEGGTVALSTGSGWWRWQRQDSVLTLPPPPPFPGFPELGGWQALARQLRLMTSPSTIPATQKCVPRGCG